jgi:phospholipid/cholesterol/gamma-HCH transport system ATP-binding protein
MIRFEHVTKRLGGRVILEDINLEVERGETLAIVGFSGAGKSVTLRHMVRLLTPDSGRVWIESDCISEAWGRQLEILRTRFGYLFQGAALLQWLTVGDNVGLPLRERLRMPEDEAQALVEEKLGMVNLSDAAAKFPDELSGGMRKRAALARAIVTSPDIILYDEPTSGLDPVTSRTIDRLIDSLRTELGVTSVMVTHDLHSALAIGSRIAMLFEGKIIEHCTPDAFVNSRQEQVQRFLEAQYINKAGAWETESKP